MLGSSIVLPIEKMDRLTSITSLEAEIDASGRQIRGRSRKGAPTGSVGGKGSGSGSGPVPANMLVRKYGLPSTAVGSTSSDSWLHREEIPTSKEISGDGKRPGQDAVEIPVNTINAPWASKANYLRAHYELLREDAVAPLRDAVAAVKALPAMQDNDVVCIYEKVRGIPSCLTNDLILHRCI